ncbi:MAG: hypothetical protein IPL08_14000 [Saprospiraceae bacterium]|nr:hypothetical protein [Saprospiraceae bacterium]
MLTNDTEKTLGEHKYNHKSQLIEHNIGRFATSGNHQYLQSMDYAYNPQGWLTGINSLYTDLLPSGIDPCTHYRQSAILLTRDRYRYPRPICSGTRL